MSVLDMQGVICTTNRRITSSWKLCDHAAYIHSRRRDRIPCRLGVALAPTAWLLLNRLPLRIANFRSEMPERRPQLSSPPTTRSPQSVLRGQGWLRPQFVAENQHVRYSLLADSLAPDPPIPLGMGGSGARQASRL